MLSFVPSSLMLGVTTSLTTDLAPVPLFWVAPLGLYLLSFIVAFANPPAWVLRGCAGVLPVACVGTIGLMVYPAVLPLWATFAVHLATFALAATACHSELARRRPAVSRLTEFYLAIALGGALGGIFNGLVAPLIFNWVAEYPLGLALAVMVLPSVWGTARARGSRALVLDAALPLVIGAVLYGLVALWVGKPPAVLPLLALAACLVFLRRPIRLALGLAAVAVIGNMMQDANRNVVLRERSFFGVLRVSADFPAGMNSLAHGNTLHGMQRRSPSVSVRRVPLMYYFPTGPIGYVFEGYQGTRVVQRVGVIGLGVGSLAGYGKTGQSFTFFEIDPAVERLARNPAYFHYLEDCRARSRVVLGDARLSLAAEPDQAFSLIVLDAFNGDAIPIHLLTRESLAIDLAKLANDGLIALHISNQYIDLEPAVHALALDVGLAGLSRNETIQDVPPNEFQQGRMPSHWVVLARRPEDLAKLAAQPGWKELQGGRDVAVWTDDYSDPFRLLRWR